MCRFPKYLIFMFYMQLIFVCFDSMLYACSLDNCQGVNNGRGSSVPSAVSPSLREEETGGGDEEASNWDKFMLLLWKNYKIQIRHKVQTVLEITLPILFTVIVVVVRCIVQPKLVQGPITFPPFRVDDVPPTPKFCW